MYSPHEKWNILNKLNVSNAKHKVSMQMYIIIKKLLLFKRSVISFTIYPVIPVIKQRCFLSFWFGVTGYCTTWRPFRVRFSCLLTWSSSFICPPEIDCFVGIKFLQWTIHIVLTISRSSRVSLLSQVLFSVLMTFTWENSLSSFPFEAGIVNRSSAKVRTLAHSAAHGAWNSRHQTAR